MPSIVWPFERFLLERGLEQRGEIVFRFGHQDQGYDVFRAPDLQVRGHRLIVAFSARVLS